MPKGKPAVLIAGAGPVGMFAAIALAKRGIRTQIVDSGVWTCSHSYALTLHHDSIELLNEIGLAERVWDVAYPVRKIGFYDAAGPKAQVHLDGNGLAVVRQSAIEDMFEKTLRDLDTPVCWKHEVTAAGNERDSAVATIDKFENDPHDAESADLEVAFVLGADGHHSQVRQALGLEFPEVGPAQYYAVFEFKSDIDLANEMRIVLGDRTTDVLWPMPDGFCRWSFQLPDYADTEAEQLKDRLLAAGFGHFPTKRLKDRAPDSAEWRNPPGLDREHLDALIAERAPWFTGSVADLSWGAIVRFERRLSSAFGRGRIWLAGDSAHVTAPAGVQSMNLGLLEADELAEHFAGILQGRTSLDTLGSYNGRWTAIWRQLHGLERGLRATPETDPWIGQYADRLIACLPTHGDGLAILASQLGLVATAK